MKAHSLTLLALVVLACALPAQEQTPKQTPRQWNCIGDPATLPTGDPSRGEIPLAGAAEGWNAFHLFTSDTWRLHTIGAGLMVRANGSPQVLVMDEEGRLFVLQEDSGKWSPHLAVSDSAPMSAWAAGDFDARLPGNEIYTGGRSGRIFRIHPEGRRFVSEIAAELDDVPLSQFVMGDWDLARPGLELVALGNDGSVHDFEPDPEHEGLILPRRLGELGTRCRDAVLLPAFADRPPRIAALLQTGEVALLTRTEKGFARTPLCEEPMSIARLARRPPRPGAAEVIYVARTDGLILRFEERAEGGFSRQPIYAGPSGPRGLAAGRFDADPEVETVAVFGYSKKVQLLSRRRSESWTVKTLFKDGGGGHWLAAAELDGRNATDELVAGGFGFHVFMLAREPGYGLDGVAVDPDRGRPDYAIPGMEKDEEPGVAPAAEHPVISQR